MEHFSSVFQLMPSVIILDHHYGCWTNA